jgi:D-alanyl-D-alanine carboxypeptidase
MKIFAFVFALPVVGFAFNASAHDPQARLKQIISKYAIEHNLSGSLTVVVGDQWYSGHSGLADQDSGRFNQSDTLFSIASNSKQFVATAILKLAEEGRLRTDDLVSKYFPELDASQFEYNEKPVRIEHLMQNTSGLQSPENGQVFKRKFMREVISMSEIIDGIRGLPLNFEPGSKFDYMDINFILAGEIIARVSGQSYSDYLRNQLFTGIDTANIQVDNKDNSDRVARSYEWHAGVRQDYMRYYEVQDGQTNEAFADGNIFATSIELARWTKILMQGLVLGEVSLRQLFTPSAASLRQNSPYAYAWSVRSCEKGHPIYFHDGGFAGYASRMMIFPHEKTSVIWLSNQPEINEDFLAEVLDIFALAVKWDGCESSLER